MLQAFFDDSGTDAKDPVVIMGGLIGTHDQWRGFAVDWRDRLLDPLPEVGKPPLGEFKAAACAGGYGEFRSYSEAERNLVTRYFRDIIIKHKLQGYACAAPRGLWDEMVTGDARAIIGNAERFCITMVAFEAFERAKAVGPNADLLIVFDERHKEVQRASEVILAVYEQHFGRTNNYATLFGPNFGPSNRVLPLQAADMLAWEYHFESRRQLITPEREPRQHFVRFHETGLLSLWTVDRRAIEEIIKHAGGPDMKEVAAAFRHDLGLD